MQNVVFQLEKTEVSKFTTQLEEKINNSILICKQIVKSKMFQDAVLNFKWKNEEQITFDRFHLSLGHSNESIYELLSTAQHAFQVNNSIKKVHIYPFVNRKELIDKLHMNQPAIWLNLNTLQRADYTDLHIAGCIILEFCKLLGFNADMYQQGKHYKNFSVPFAVSHLVTFVGRVWAEKYPISFGHIECKSPDQEVYLHPSTDTLDLRLPNQDISLAYQKINESIDLLYKEWFTLKKDNSNSAINRILTIRSSISSLESVQQQLLDSSLDGAEHTFQSPPVFNL